MASTARFAYLQVRLQAHHGARIDVSAWRRLQGSADFANYLRLAQQTALRPWVMSLHPGQDSSEIEQTLRRQFRNHVEEVAGWAPGEPAGSANRAMFSSISSISDFGT